MVKNDNKTVLTDKESYNDFYRDKISDLYQFTHKSDYIKSYQSVHLLPFFKGGSTKGFVRGLTLKYLTDIVKEINKTPGELTILDAGSGQGELSVYLACLGFNVVGIEISESGCKCGRILAEKFEVNNNCIFFEESLEKTSLKDNSIDFVIGHAALHHFIKYKGVTSEFQRVMKNNSYGFFADGFGENKLYHLFHDKEKMQRLGDVTLTLPLLNEYFKDFELNVTPTDWFVMFDKLNEKLFPKSLSFIPRKLSYFFFKLDRLIPVNRVSTYLSGSVMTVIKKRSI